MNFKHENQAFSDVMVVWVSVGILLTSVRVDVRINPVDTAFTCVDIM